MIPLKDNIPHERFPLLTLTLIALGIVVAFLFSGNLIGLVALLIDLLVLWLLGPSVEGALGRVRFCGVCLLGGLLAIATWALADGSSATIFAVTGITTVVLGGYLLLYPRARVLTLVTVPFFMTIVEVPATIVIGVWLALQLYLGIAGPG